MLVLANSSIKSF